MQTRIILSYLSRESDLVALARQIATQAHAGQKRKRSFADYIIHPTRISARLRGAGACRNYRPVLSVFDQSKFAEPVAGSREMFSHRPGAPLKRQVIMNPLQFIENQGLDVKFVGNIDKLYKSSMGKSDFMGADGNFE